MKPSWKRLKAALRAAKKREDIVGLEVTIPSHFSCPISLDLMKDPVTLSTGITYDRENIERWIEDGNATCPMTKKALRSLEPVPNHAIRKIIQDWCEENRAYGVERIPTPRIPITSHEVHEILSEFEVAMHTNSYKHCLELVSKLKGSAKESERNRRCIVGNGTARVLSASFEALSRRDSVQEHASLLEEMLSILSMGLPSLDEEGKSNLSKIHSLHAIVWLLRYGSLSGQRNAASVLKTVISGNCQRKVEELMGIEGVLEALVKLIKEPICPATTKASLVSIFLIVSASESISGGESMVKRLILEMGFVGILLETLVDSDRSTCEKALGVLDRICDGADGIRVAGENALIVPLLAKKVLRVSSVSTDFSVSILWKLVKCDGGRVIGEAVQAGAFQKLLLLLQVGCKESTKEKATELLKVMNLNRNSVESGDCLDFKNSKNPIDF